jgi:hypothetical protein
MDARPNSDDEKPRAHLAVWIWGGICLLVLVLGLWVWW